MSQATGFVGSLLPLTVYGNSGTDVTDDVLRLEEGSLYPALHRMERRGWLESEWGVSDNNRQVKYYRLTRRGREYLQRESSGWKEFATAVFKVLQTT